jgi:hypothetical protein
VSAPGAYNELACEVGSEVIALKPGAQGTLWTAKR